jgi:hypothetical protein
VLENPLQNLKEKAAWWFGTWLLFFHMLGIIIPSDFIFFRGVGQPPTSSSDLSSKNGTSPAHFYRVSVAENWTWATSPEDE